MTQYEVKLTSRGERDFQNACQWYAERSTVAANNWYDGTQLALDSLKGNPERCPLADENLRFPIELRQLTFGSGRKLTHRIIFAIRPDAVVVYAIRHTAQDEWRPENPLDQIS